MYAYEISYGVDVEYADGTYDSESFDNLPNAEYYVDDCIEDGNFNDNPLTYYKITKTETDGGMIVDEEVIEESDSPKQKYGPTDGRYAYVISYRVDVEYEDGEEDGDSFDNIYNAEDFVDDCIEDGDYNDNPVVYYKITKTESEAGHLIDEEIVKEWEL